jgi:hypothetical protein
MPKYTSGGGANILPDGEYDYEVEGASLGTSKANNEMIRLELRINGQLIIDYLVFSNGGTARIDQFRESYGDMVLVGEVIEINPSDLIGKTGRCTLITEVWEGRPRNKVGSYVKAKAPTTDNLPL